MESFNRTMLYFVVGFVALLFSTFTVFLLYLHYIHRIYAHIPGPPRPSFILGHLPDIARWRKSGKTTHPYFVQNRQQYGPIYVLFFVHRATVVIGDPVYVKELLITNRKFLSKVAYGSPFGTRFLGTSVITLHEYGPWKERRRLLDPAYHRSSLKNFMTGFNTVCDRFVNRITNLVDERQDAHMAQELSRATLDIISEVSFNVNLGAIEDPDSPFGTTFVSMLRVFEVTNFFGRILSYGIFKYLPFRTGLTKSQIDGVNFLRNFARECITRRMDDMQADKSTPDDLMSILINNKSLSMEDMIDEFVTTFLAGHETTANSLAFTLYEVAQNPDIEKKILDEVNEVLGEKEYVEYEDLSKLKYLGQVLQEGLRMYPIADGAAKNELLKEMTIGGYRLPKGVEIMIPKYPINRNPEYWENPDVFDPERFSSPEKIPNFRTLYFPFSVGPRNCIGQNVAKFESKVILARILRKFRFELLPGQTAAIEQRFTLAPRDGVICKVTVR